MLITLDTLRRFYGRYVTAVGQCQDARIEAAFSQVRREDYLPPGPWQIFTFGGGYVETVNDDPAQLYQDILIALDADAGVNNGQPSLHARCLAAVAPKAGESVLHVGAGMGYYSAILAELVGEGGTVLALELDEDLAAQAQQNVQGYAQVTVENRSGSKAPLPESDVIYVSAGAAEPLPCWLASLKPNGRLIFPLTPAEGMGAMLLVTRAGTARDCHARFVMSAQFISCAGGQETDPIRALSKAFARRDSHLVRALRWGVPENSEDCWLAGDGWWLSRTPLAA